MINATTKITDTKKSLKAIYALGGVSNTVLQPEGAAAA